MIVGPTPQCSRLLFNFCPRGPKFPIAEWCSNVISNPPFPKDQGYLPAQLLTISKHPYTGTYVIQPSPFSRCRPTLRIQASPHSLNSAHTLLRPGRKQDAFRNVSECHASPYQSPQCSAKGHLTQLLTRATPCSYRSDIQIRAGEAILSHA
jgi:hypothetical protein